MANENDVPKLYSTKPKKSQLKKTTTPAPNPTMDPIPPPPPPPSSSVPPPQTQSFARRYKFVWPVLLAVNLAIGGYLFLRTNKKNKSEEDGEVTAEVRSTLPANTTPTPAASTTVATSVLESPIAPAPVAPVKVHEPISEEMQRELLKWILEEKRKVKPNDPEEKKRLDEEKALLKQFIKGKSIPNI